MGVHVAESKRLAEERGGWVFIVTDDNHPGIEAVLSFSLRSGGKAALESLEVALKHLRSKSSGSIRPRTEEVTLTPSEIAALPLSRWHRAAEAHALSKHGDIRASLKKAQVELERRKPSGKGEARRLRARQRLVEIAEEYLRNRTDPEIESPVKAIADRHGWTQEKARTLVFRARRDGLLPSERSKG